MAKPKVNRTAGRTKAAKKIEEAPKEEDIMEFDTPDIEAAVTSADVETEGINDDVNLPESDDDKPVLLDGNGEEPATELPVVDKVSVDPQKAIAQASATAASVAAIAPGNDRVRIAMTETVDPAPRVGEWRAVNELGLTSLIKGSTHVVPRYVAEVLTDSRVCTIVG